MRDPAGRRVAGRPAGRRARLRRRRGGPAGLPGENAEVDRLLRGDVEPTRVEGSARWYTRFLAAARSLRGGVRAGRSRRPRGAVRQAAVPRPARRRRRAGAAVPHVRRAGGRGGLAGRAGLMAQSGCGGSSSSSRTARRPRGCSPSRRPAPAGSAPPPRWSGPRTAACTTRCGCAATRTSRRSRRSSTGSRRTGCTSSAGCPRRRWATGRRTCGSWWWPAGPPTRWSAPAAPP